MARLGGILLLSLLVLVALVLATINLPWARARLAEEVSRRASRALAGTVNITRIGHIGLGSISGIDAELLDTSRRRVLTVSDSSLDIDLVVLIHSLVGDAPLTLAFEHIALSGVDARFLKGPEGGLSLVEAFEPASGAAGTPAETKEATPSPPPRFRFERVTLEHASLQGELGGFDDLDVVLRDVVASGSIEAESVRFELARVDISARQLPGIPVHARARYVDQQMSGYLELETTPSSLQRLWPDIGVEDPVRLFIGFEGTPERLRLLAVFESSAGELYVDGHVALSPRVSGRVSILGQQLEARRWIREIPESSVQLAAALRFEVDDGIRGQLALRTWSATWEGRTLPDLALSLRLMEDEARATLHFELGGGRAEVGARVSPLRSRNAEARQLEVSVAAMLPDLARLGAELGLPEPLGGDAQLDARASLELEGAPSIVAGRLSARLRSITAGSVSMRSASLEIFPAGPLSNPRLDLSLDASGLGLPGYPLRRVQLRAQGVMDELAIGGHIAPEAASPARLAARIFPTRQLARDIQLSMDEKGPAGAVRFSAERLGRSASGWEVRHLEIEGPFTGRLALDASVRGSRVRAEGRAVDFAPALLARQLGLDLELPRGVADLGFAVDYRPGHVSGRVQGRVTRVCVGELRGGTLETDLAVTDNVIDGVATIRVPDLVEGRIRAESLALPARWEPSQLSLVKGELELVAETDLAKLQSFSRASALPPSSRGQLRARLLLTAAPGEASPKLRVELSAQDLAWSAASDTPKPGAARAGVAAEPASATWQGMDVEVVGEADTSRVQASAVVVDSRGALLASVKGSTSLSLARLLRQPEAFDPRELPIELSAEIPTRELDAFPLPLRFARLDGALSARATATGTVGRPKIAGHVKLTKLRLERGRALPLAITADAELEAEQLTLTAVVHDEQRQLLSLLSEAKVSGGGAPPAIERLDLDLRSNGLPLESLGAALGVGVSGELYGSLHVENLPRRPTARGTMWINDVRLDGFRQDQARWVIDADSDSFSTEVELRQAIGRARAVASGPWSWRRQLLPVLDARQTHLELDARDFDLEGLRAILPEQARALSGRLDADLSVDSGEKPGVRGSLQLREGGIYLAALGQEFHDIALDASAEPSGVVKISRLSARTLSGKMSARGEVTLDGLAPRSARLSAKIPRNDPLPFMFEGVTVAEAWGRVYVDARLDPGAGKRQRLEINVNVPRLRVRLPEQSPHDVQELDDDPTITTGTYLGPSRFLTLPIPPSEEEGSETTAAPPPLVSIEIRLGDKVWLERGTQVEVKLSGNVALELKEKLSARGEVRLARGIIDVQGRRFEIERGVITFVEERAPSNPTVVATARYTAPEGTEVYADFVGPVKTGTLSLRSEPPSRQDQILSLLLFGTPEGNFGASTGEGSDAFSGAALAAGGSLVTRGLNQELRRFTALDIQTRIGESEGQPQPEVVVQISPRLTAELGYSIGTPNPGRQEDRTYLTLDLRLFRNWSLSTTVGDAGSLLVDLLWRYRY